MCAVKSTRVLHEGFDDNIRSEPLGEHFCVQPGIRRGTEFGAISSVSVIVVGKRPEGRRSDSLSPSSSVTLKIE